MLDTMHHVAITVENIERAVNWYAERFKFKLKWQDETWALLEFENISMALVTPQQHPPHIAFVTNDLESFGTPVKHRDGTASVYIPDGDGNTVEMLSVPTPQEIP